MALRRQDAPMGQAVRGPTVGGRRGRRENQRDCLPLRGGAMRGRRWVPSADSRFRSSASPRRLVLLPAPRVLAPGGPYQRRSRSRRPLTMSPRARPGGSPSLPRVESVDTSVSLYYRIDTVRLMHLSRVGSRASRQKKGCESWHPAIRLILTVPSARDPWLPVAGSRSCGETT